VAAKMKSERQVRFLLSKVSPLTKNQKHKLVTELHSGAVKIKHTPSKTRGK